VNEKARMNTKEFKKYLTYLRHLHPYMADVPGKRVLLKVDSGPGRNDEGLVVWARSQGLILYPGVPNTAAVSQETDRSYGPFKSAFSSSLGELTRQRMKTTGNSGQPSFGPSNYGLIIFGGTEDGLVLTNLFQACFSTEMNLSNWEKIGACPLTRQCLTDEKVRHETVVDEDGIIDVDADPQGKRLEQIEAANAM
jgi:hypothetical protein